MESFGIEYKISGWVQIFCSEFFVAVNKVYKKKKSATTLSKGMDVGQEQSNIGITGMET